MNIENILGNDQGMKELKRKSLLFFEKLSIAIFGLCVYFLLVLNSASEIFEQSRFGRDTISLYEKSKRIKSFFLRAKQEQYILLTKITTILNNYIHLRKKILAILVKSW